MKRAIYIYQANMSPELIAIFEHMNDMVHIEKVEDDVITVVDMDYFNEEPIDFEEIFLLLVQDFDGDITFLIEPYLEESFTLSEELKTFMKTLPHNLYYFEDMITYAVIRNNEPLKQLIKQYISRKVNPEVIHTVREFISNNMNSSVSAKKLFMHRNTLNYRIDNFIEATNINVKTFKGANAIYMLYKF